MKTPVNLKIALSTLLVLFVLLAARYQKIAKSELSEALLATSKVEEAPMDIESWMTDDELWQFDERAVADDLEASLSIEPWMTNDGIWKFPS